MPYPRIGRLGPPGHRTRPGARRSDAEWNRFQAEILHACTIADLVIAITAVRTGKTGTQAAFHYYTCRDNPGIRTIWLAESYKWFKKVAKPVCEELFGHLAIWHGTNHTYTFPGYGGSEIVVCTYRDLQSMQGITAGAGSIDEYQNQGIDAYNELEQRVSDPRIPNPSILITGLPVWASWALQMAEDQKAAAFKDACKSAKAGKRVPCILFDSVASAVNTANIHPRYLERLRRNLSPEEFKRRLLGLAPKPEGRVFSNFEAVVATQANLNTGNLLRWTYDHQLGTSADLDFGSRMASMLVSQDFNPRHGLATKSLDDCDVFFAEYHPDTPNCSTAAMIKWLAAEYAPRGKDPNRRPLDAIYCDPAGNSVQTATRLTDIRLLREAFPETPIHYTYNSKLRHVPSGIELLQSRILSESGRRRMFLSEELWNAGLRDRRKGALYTRRKPGRSLALAIARTEYPESADGKVLSDNPIKCPIDSHALDAWRYHTTNKYGKGRAAQFAAR